MSTLKSFVFVAMALMGSAALTERSVHAEQPMELSDVEVADPGLQACIKSWAGEEINQYRYVRDVKELGCPDRGINSLEGIAIFRELLAIDLSNNPIEDYSPLYALAKYERLGFLWLWGNEISCREEKALRKRLPKTWIAGAHCSP